MLSALCAVMQQKNPNSFTRSDTRAFQLLANYNTEFYNLHTHKFASQFWLRLPMARARAPRRIKRSLFIVCFMHRSCHPHGRSDAHIKQLALQYTFVFIVRNAHYIMQGLIFVSICCSSTVVYDCRSLDLFVPALISKRSLALHKYARLL